MMKVKNMPDAADTSLGDELIASLREGMAILRGDQTPARAWQPPAQVDVRAIRARTGLSQEKFARRFGFTPAAVRDWEQQRRQPEAAARVLLLVIASRPDIVDEVLAASAPQAA
jgi:putative transcriptional regulator